MKRGELILLWTGTLLSTALLILDQDPIYDEQNLNAHLVSLFGQGQNRTSDTRIFSPLTVARLCVTIGRYWYLFKRLTAVSAGRFYRFEHIATHSSFKAHSKQGGDQ